MYRTKIEPMSVIKIWSYLLDMGVYRLIADFDGGGDDGDIHNVDFYSYEDDIIEIEKVRYDNIKEWLYDALDQCTWDLNVDWVNNDGGWGEINAIIPDKKLDIDLNARTTEHHGWDTNVFD